MVGGGQGSHLVAVPCVFEEEQLDLFSNLRVL